MWLMGFSLILLLILKDYEASMDFFNHTDRFFARFSTLILIVEKPVGFIFWKPQLFKIEEKKIGIEILVS